MIRLYDLNSCEWRVFPSAAHVPAGASLRDEQGKRWTPPEPAETPSEQPASEAIAPRRKRKA